MEKESSCDIIIILSFPSITGNNFGNFFDRCTRIQQFFISFRVIVRNQDTTISLSSISSGPSGFLIKGLNGKG